MTESGSARIMVEDIPEDDELLELYSAVGWTAYRSGACWPPLFLDLHSS